MDILNNPFIWPYIGLEPGEALSIGPIPEETSVEDSITGDPITPQGPVNDLAILRHNFPFCPIIPFPNQVRTVALVQNVPKDIVIPDRVVMVMLRGSGNYYVSNNGNAEVPVAAQDNDSGTNAARSIFKPDGVFFYTGGIKSLSVITPDAGGCIVTLLGYAPTEMPRYV